MRTSQIAATCILFCGLVSVVWAQKDASDAKEQPPEKSEVRKLSDQHPIWFDRGRKMVIADGEICLRKGTLEMFACLQGTKEHESIVSVPIKAMMLHAGLIAIGAQQGTPVKFSPEFKPASGEEIAIYVQWKDDKGKTQIANAKDWVRKTGTKDTLDTNWVFAGSYFWNDERNGEKVYTAESGDLVCVSNFPTATLDLPIESSQENANLSYEAFTDRIPPEGTKVRLFFVPKFKKEEAKPAIDEKNPQPIEKPEPMPKEEVKEEPKSETKEEPKTETEVPAAETSEAEKPAEKEVATE
ncbi:YdjY domain-containing protein [Blastopirellula sp. JC732]|uniref:YdjY domain-containing protein n=1 Tax=Blastopirellula sediminis TaxID=2894196 RepID=A0A9X1MHS1_9BACT|nr:YdjY domain-containing protein [Blastopirellula sediminis]MCC9608201.1 YdjY domain-containing protein [Blastopirellula sediminis]MCC9627006.1 YdjY domain-containing protein [Blastopirellula sediminis]